MGQSLGGDQNFKTLRKSERKINLSVLYLETTGCMHSCSREPRIAILATPAYSVTLNSRITYHEKRIFKKSRSNVNVSGNNPEIIHNTVPI